MTMLKKNTYTIDGEELQEKILSEIDAVKHCYRKWKEHDSEEDFYYMLFKEHLAILRMLLTVQGNSKSEVAMIINYTKDLAEQKFYRVWNIVKKNQDGSSKYNGFTEIAATSPRKAVIIAENAEREHKTSSDAIIVGFEVDRISDLSGDGAVIENCGEF